jgi:pimeloyl-ACP methyl ester carboxylesterase
VPDQKVDLGAATGIMSSTWPYLCWGALGAVATVCGVLLLEQILEWLDERRFNKDATFVHTSFGRVRYQLFGREIQGPPLVFLNGATGVCEQWELAQVLMRGIGPTLAYDRGGTGYSRSSAASVVEQADELAELLTSLKFDRPAVVVAYSLAGSLGRIFAARHKDKVAALVLIDPTMVELDSRVPGRHSPIRMYWRWYLTDTLAAWTGWDRLNYRFRGKGPKTMALPHAENRARAGMFRSRHWWAVVRELLVSGDTAREVAHCPMGDTPLLFLLGEAPEAPNPSEDEYERVINEVLSRASVGGMSRLRGHGHVDLLISRESMSSIARSIQEFAARLP